MTSVAGGGKGRTRVRPLLLLLALLGFSGNAFGAELEIWPESAFQVAQYRDIDRLRVDSTRFSETLTLNIYESRPHPRHSFFMSLRLDLDVGSDHSLDSDINHMPPYHYAVLYANYQGRRLDDLLDLTVGRQLISDELGFCSFDGARLTLYRDFFLGLDLYAGSQLRGALSERRQNLYLPNSNVFEPDGIKSQARLTGLYGAALFLNGLQDTNLRLQFRRGDSGRADTQTLGLAFRQRLFHLWEFYSVNRFNLLLLRPAQLDFGTRFDFGFVGFSIDHESRHAYFDGSSIWNFFDVYGSKSLSASFFIAPDSETTLRLRYAHLTQSGSFPLFDNWGHRGNASDQGSLDFTRRLPRRSELHSGYRFDLGWGGDSHAVYLGSSIELFERRWRLAADFSGNHFARLLYTDMLGKDRNRGFSYGFVGRSSLRLTDEIELTTEAEALSGPYIERQFRFFTLLDVHAWL